MSSASSDSFPISPTYFGKSHELVKMAVRGGAKTKFLFEREEEIDGYKMTVGALFIFLPNNAFTWVGGVTGFPQEIPEEVLDKAIASVEAELEEANTIVEGMRKAKKSEGKGKAKK